VHSGVVLINMSCNKKNATFVIVLTQALIKLVTKTLTNNFPTPESLQYLSNDMSL